MNTQEFGICLVSKMTMMASKFGQFDLILELGTKTIIEMVILQINLFVILKQEQLFKMISRNLS